MNDHERIYDGPGLKNEQKKIFFWLVQRVVARPLRPLARMAPEMLHIKLNIQHTKYRMSNIILHITLTKVGI